MNRWFGVLCTILYVTHERSPLAVESNEPVHFYLLAVPESKLNSLRLRAARQEEAAGGAASAIGAGAQGAGAYIGLILNGVLGGDVRPIFAGSTAFIPEGDVRDGLGDILQNGIAPALNRIFKELQQQIQRQFNQTSTTPRSAQIVNQQNQNQQYQQNIQQQQSNFNQNLNQYQPQNVGQQQQQSTFNQNLQTELLNQNQAAASTFQQQQPQQPVNSNQYQHQPQNAPLPNFPTTQQQQNPRIDPLQPNFMFQRSDLEIPQTPPSR